MRPGRQIGNLLDRCIEGGELLLALCGSFLILALMILVVYSVVARQVFHHPAGWSVESAEFLMVGIVLLPLAWTNARKRHVTIELVAGRLPARVRLWLDLGTSLAVLLFAALLAWKSWDFAWFARVNDLRWETAGSLPLFPVRLVVPLGTFFLVLRVMLDIARVMATMRAAPRLQGRGPDEPRAPGLPAGY